MTIREYREANNLPANLRADRILTDLIRSGVAGGREVLAVLTRLHEMQHGRGPQADPLLTEMIGLLLRARDAMAAEAKRKNGID